ncbi:hypothetical protein BGZ76_002145 [Entomortierella beljakovae]|nr:hypothetical protein BGZ76_002145 [Entomortierella beljakovae]
MPKSPSPEIAYFQGIDADNLILQLPPAGAVKSDLVELHKESFETLDELNRLFKYFPVEADEDYIHIIVDDPKQGGDRSESIGTGSLTDGEVKQALMNFEKSVIHIFPAKQLNITKDSMKMPKFESVWP